MDTLTLGKFNAGGYELKYTLYSDTAPEFIYDKDSINFTVFELNDIPLYRNIDQGIELYPNPTSDVIHIEFKNLKERSYTLGLYSLIGQKMISLTDKRAFISMDLRDLSLGIYLMVIAWDDEKQSTLKIIKHTP